MKQYLLILAGSLLMFAATAQSPSPDKATPPRVNMLHPLLHITAFVVGQKKITL